MSVDDMDRLEERWQEDNYIDNVKGFISLYHFEFLDWLADTEVALYGWRFMDQWVMGPKKKEYLEYERDEFKRWCEDEGDAMAQLAMDIEEERE